MKKIKTIYVLTDYKRIPLFFSCKPFLDYKGSNYRFKIVFSINKLFKGKKSQHLILIRHPKSDLNLDNLFLKIRVFFKFIAYFDDEDSARIARPEILKYVDVYFKKQIYKDKDFYLNRDQSIPTYVEYYRKKRTNHVDTYNNKINHLDLEKLQVAWNLSVGIYPMNTIRIRMASLAALFFGAKPAYIFLKAITKLNKFPYSKKKDIISCQFSIPDNEDYSYQRRIIRDAFSEDERAVKTFSSERSYKKSLSSSKLTISPYGWGEICFRDTEAIIAGSALVKPNMDHLETWPNIYQAFETYYSLPWDLKDTKVKVDELLKNEKLLNNLTIQAKKTLFEQL